MRFLSNMCYSSCRSASMLFLYVVGAGLPILQAEPASCTVSVTMCRSRVANRAGSSSSACLLRFIEVARPIIASLRSVSGSSATSGIILSRILAGRLQVRSCGTNPHISIPNFSPSPMHARHHWCTFFLSHPQARQCLLPLMSSSPTPYLSFMQIDVTTLCALRFHFEIYVCFHFNFYIFLFQ